jgi:hypothetical protein
MGIYSSLSLELTPTFDIPKSHEWTLNLNSEEDPDFTLESSLRSGTFLAKGKPRKRFWIYTMPCHIFKFIKIIPNR